MSQHVSSDGFGPVPADVLEQSRTLHLKQGEVLFRQGDHAPGFVLVQSGTVRVFKTDPEGREIVLYRVHEGQSCMLTTVCLMGRQPYPAQGVAESDVCLCLLSVSQFERLLTDSRSFRDIVMQHFAQRMLELMRLIEDVAFMRMDMRLARLLLQRQQQGHLQVTHQELACELGTAREVISRLLKSFAEHGWIRMQRGRLAIIDEQALQALSSE